MHASLVNGHNKGLVLHNNTAACVYHVWFMKVACGEQWDLIMSTFYLVHFQDFLPLDIQQNHKQISVFLKQWSSFVYVWCEGDWGRKTQNITKLLIICARSNLGLFWVIIWSMYTRTTGFQKFVVLYYKIGKYIEFNSQHKKITDHQSTQVNCDFYVLAIHLMHKNVNPW